MIDEVGNNSHDADNNHTVLSIELYFHKIVFMYKFSRIFKHISTELKVHIIVLVLFRKLDVYVSFDFY